MSKKRVLGQGLDALLGEEFDMSLPETMLGFEGVKMLPIHSIVPNPEQPRQKFNPESMSELAESIRQQGVIQPLLAEKRTDGTYMLVAGERRWRASQEAGLVEVPVLVREFSFGQKLEIALIENIQRENLTPIEEARAYHQLMEALDLSQQEVADKVGKNRSTVANSLRLLKLPDSMKKAVEEGLLSAGHARSLLSVTNPADQEQLFSKMLNQDLSVRDAETMAVSMNRSHKDLDPLKRKNNQQDEIIDPEMNHLQERFIEALGTRVRLKGSFSKGKIEITWYNKDDLERIYSLFFREE